MYQGIIYPPTQEYDTYDKCVDYGFDYGFWKDPEPYFGFIKSPIFLDNDLECERQDSINIPPAKGTKRKAGENELRLKRQKQESVTIVPNNPKRAPHRPVMGYLSTTKDADKYLLFCNHCKTQFYSKTTFRGKYQHHLVNHRCANISNSRLQYVVGIRHRRCTHRCHPQVGCIRFVQRRKKPGTQEATIVRKSEHELDFHFE